MSRDPIGEMGGLNLYAFVGNDPINLIDPYGLKDWGKIVAGATMSFSGLIVFVGVGAATYLLYTDNPVGWIEMIAFPGHVATLAAVTASGFGMMGWGGQLMSEGWQDSGDCPPTNTEQSSNEPEPFLPVPDEPVVARTNPPIGPGAVQHTISDPIPTRGPAPTIDYELGGAKRRMNFDPTPR